MFKSIKTALSVILIPIVTLGLALVTIVSGVSSSNQLNAQIDQKMEQQVIAAEFEISESLVFLEATAQTIATMVGASYTSCDAQVFVAAISNIMKEVPYVIGGGFFFEPYQFDDRKEFCAPYLKNNDGIIELYYGYAEPSYNYFGQEYYVLGLMTAGTTDPYIDELTGIQKISTYAPIKNLMGKVIGVVVIDVSIDHIQDLVADIYVGKTGHTVLLDSEGKYIYDIDLTKPAAEIALEADSATALSSCATGIMNGYLGETEYTDAAGTTFVYYNTVDETGWKVVLTIDKSEVNAPIDGLLRQLIVVSALIVIVVAVVVILVINNMAKKIKKLSENAIVMADGDYRENPVAFKGKDEIAGISNALTTLHSSTKEMVAGITDHSASVNSASAQLNGTSKEMLEEFGRVEEAMSRVSEAMMNVGSSTEEVNASVEEVNAAVNILAQEAKNSKHLANEIMDRATSIEKKSVASSESTQELSVKFQAEVQQGIENAKVVESIGMLTEVISSIAEQINLLSLNASIEAARAGEQGRGFAVVAAEIGKLANETSEAVVKIQETISEVSAAFDGMTGSSKRLLEFLDGTVTKDYKDFVDVAKQYGADAGSVEQMADKVASMSASLEEIIRDVANAVESIAESSQHTVEDSSQVTGELRQAGEAVAQVTEMSGTLMTTASELTEMVEQFKL